MRHLGAFRLAAALGKHLHEVMAWPSPPTHRQALAWLMFLDLRDGVSGSNLSAAESGNDLPADGPDRESVKAAARKRHERNLQERGWVKGTLTPDQREQLAEEIRRAGGTDILVGGKV